MAKKVEKNVVKLEKFTDEDMITVKESELHDTIANLPEDRSDSLLGDKKALILGMAVGTISAGFGLWYSATLTKFSNKQNMEHKLSKYNKGSFRRLNERI